MQLAPVVADAACDIGMQDPVGRDRATCVVQAVRLHTNRPPGSVDRINLAAAVGERECGHGDVSAGADAPGVLQACHRDRKFSIAGERARVDKCVRA